MTEKLRLGQLGEPRRLGATELVRNFRGREV
jgi:hypothetical protein